MLQDTRGNDARVRALPAYPVVGRSVGDVVSIRPDKVVRVGIYPSPAHLEPGVKVTAVVGYKVKYDPQTCLKIPGNSNDNVVHRQQLREKTTTNPKNYVG